MPPVLDQVQRQAPVQEREGARLRRAYEEKKGRSMTLDDLGPGNKTHAISRQIQGDVPELWRTLKRLKAVDPIPYSTEVVRGAPNAPTESIPVPADDPTLINHFNALIEKMRVGPLPSKRYRRERIPSHGVDA